MTQANSKTGRVVFAVLGLAFGLLICAFFCAAVWKRADALAVALGWENGWTRWALAAPFFVFLRYAFPSWRSFAEPPSLLFFLGVALVMDETGILYGLLVFLAVLSYASRLIRWQSLAEWRAAWMPLFHFAAFLGLFVGVGATAFFYACVEMPRLGWLYWVIGVVGGLLALAGGLFLFGWTVVAAWRGDAWRDGESPPKARDGAA